MEKTKQNELKAVDAVTFEELPQNIEAKDIKPMGLTQKQWKQYNDLLAYANQEQIEKMIELAAKKLPTKTITVTG